ncbi:MAG: FeoB-associated Cys-rich membrane protein [Deltaproteobacteria bacterium]|jgi:hypothetical protein|nr:FeoB-associated Cys-rich membrane protein [Deltaproteobacteria bacterium]
METIIIVAIIVAALGFSIYRIFVKPSCSCGCCGKKKNWSETDLQMDEDAEEKPLSGGKS